MGSIPALGVLLTARFLDRHRDRRILVLLAQSLIQDFEPMQCAATMLTGPQMSPDPTATQPVTVTDLVSR